MSWEDIESAFGTNSHRRRLLAGLRKALISFGRGGCKSVSIDGSFVTTKENPNDVDGTWDNEGVNYGRIDPILTCYEEPEDIDAMKKKYGVEFYPDACLTTTGITHLRFFQMDRELRGKGIVKIDPRSLL